MTSTATPDSADRPDSQPIPEVVDLDVVRNQPAPVGDSRSEALWASRRDEVTRDRLAAHEAFERQIEWAQQNHARRLSVIDDRERALLELARPIRRARPHHRPRRRRGVPPRRPTLRLGLRPHPLRRAVRGPSPRARTPALLRLLVARLGPLRSRPQTWTRDVAPADAKGARSRRPTRCRADRAPPHVDMSTRIPWPRGPRRPSSCPMRPVDQRRWDRNYAEYRRYVAERGHGMIPKNHVTSSGLALGKWAANQRDLWQTGRLLPDRLNTLLGDDSWPFSPREQAWLSKYALLCNFVATHGRGPYQSESHEGVRLGVWVRTQRRAYREGRMDATRRALLQGVPGWVWNAAAPPRAQR